MINVTKLLLETIKHIMSHVIYMLLILLCTYNNVICNTFSTTLLQNFHL